MPLLGDLDYLAARLHGRRGRMACGPRLRDLCGLGTPAALAEALFPASGIISASGIQARLAEDLVKEIRGISRSLSGAQAAFIGWQGARFQLENLKVMVRALDAGRDRGEAARLLTSLPADIGYGPELAAAKDRAGLLAALPAGIFRASLAKAYAARTGEGALFFYEAALDRDYLAELAARAAALAGEDRDYACRLCAQEAAVFNLALASRGRFSYSLDRKPLLEHFAPGARFSRRRFGKMLDAAGPGELTALAGAAVEPGRPEPAASGAEALAWRRYAQLALRAFRGSHIGFGAAAAYLALRRVEVSDLTTISEGLRLKLEAGEILRRLSGVSYV